MNTKTIFHTDIDLKKITQEMTSILLAYNRDDYNGTNAKSHLDDLSDEARIILKRSLKHKDKKIVQEAKNSLLLLDELGKRTEKFVEPNNRLDGHKCKK